MSEVDKHKTVLDSGRDGLKCYICDYESGLKTTYYMIDESVLCGSCFFEFDREAKKLNEGNSIECCKCGTPISISIGYEETGMQVTSPTNKRKKMDQLYAGIFISCGTSGCLWKDVRKNWRSGLLSLPWNVK